KTPGVRYLHDLALARQGYADDEATALQAHFTNTAPAIADVDGDGTEEVVLLASVQNAAQSDRERGVALWVVRSDASRLPAFETPFHAPGFLSGLWDYGDNIVAITNQATVADLDPDRPGKEILFAGFDGKIHAVTAAATELWTAEYTARDDVATGGVVVGDLSGDGIPEVVFASYSTAQGQGALHVLSAAGAELHRLALPGRGGMPVPTLADVDGDGTVEILVSLKDAEDRVESVRVYEVAGSATNCLPWPTGRGNLLRSGWAR
ncbi:MAG: VCBS repeat-containing protein, partial [Deltaproteobacteria bacterium]|nr:VCBS repeat-containing protein [Deltaproteobacteria bacterium]